MYNCTHPLMKKAVSEGKRRLLDRARDCRINREVMEKFMQFIECGIAAMAHRYQNSYPNYDVLWLTRTPLERPNSFKATWQSH
jgi:hypothetical protein